MGHIIISASVWFQLKKKKRIPVFIPQGGILRLHSYLPASSKLPCSLVLELNFREGKHCSFSRPPDIARSCWRDRSGDLVVQTAVCVCAWILKICNDNNHTSPPAGWIPAVSKPTRIFMLVNQICTARSLKHVLLFFTLNSIIYLFLRQYHITYLMSVIMYNNCPKYIFIYIFICQQQQTETTTYIFQPQHHSDNANVYTHTLVGVTCSPL